MILMRKMKMTKKLNKLLKITLIFILLGFTEAYSIEDVSEFTDAINEVREGLIISLMPRQNNLK